MKYQTTVLLLLLLLLGSGCASPIAHQRRLNRMSADLHEKCESGVKDQCPDGAGCAAARARCAAAVPCMRALERATAAWQEAAKDVAAGHDARMSTAAALEDQSDRVCATKEVK